MEAAVHPVASSTPSSLTRRSQNAQNAQNEQQSATGMLFTFFSLSVPRVYIQVSSDDSSITRYINGIKAPGYRGLGLIKRCNEINLHLERG